MRTEEAEPAAAELVQAHGWGWTPKRQAALVIKIYGGGMTHKEISQRERDEEEQRRVAVSGFCVECGTPIAKSTNRPRLYCGCRCRKRRQKRNERMRKRENEEQVSGLDLVGAGRSDHRAAVAASGAR
jgi:hypothetical protein